MISFCNMVSALTCTAFRQKLQPRLDFLSFFNAPALLVIGCVDTESCHPRMRAGHDDFTIMLTCKWPVWRTPEGLLRIIPLNICLNE